MSEVVGPKTLSDFEKTVIRLVPEGLGFGVSTGLEMIRAGLVNPKYSLERAGGLNAEPNLDPTSPLFGILQNSGDLHDGYWIGMVAYNLIEGIDLAQNRFTKKYIPQRVKQGFSMLMAIGVVTSYEIGVLTGSNPDPNDIPAGVLGGLIYLGINSFARRFANRVARYKESSDRK